MKNEKKILYVLLTAILGVLVLNQVQITGMYNAMNSNMYGTLNSEKAGQTNSNAGTISFDEAVKEALPTGVPETYGNELGVSFDNVEESLSILMMLDGDLYEEGNLKYEDLTEEQKERYVLAGSSISCEFCCDAVQIVFEGGQPACGCSHSAAMRGLAKYLLINHGEMSDEKILEELTKWKSVFFPKEMVDRYIELQGGSVRSSVLPDMVGGC